MKFIFFRHGETEANAKSIIQGAGIDLPLNIKGIQQAKLLAEKTPSLGLEKIYSSRLTRALQTATLSAATCGLDVEPIEGVEEFHYGDAEGMTLDEAFNLYGRKALDLVVNENDALMDECLPNGESVRKCQVRVFSTLEKIKAENLNLHCIGIFTHGAVMCYLYQSWFKQFKLFENCEWFEMEI